MQSYLVVHFSEDYINYSREGGDSYFLFGDSGDATIVGYAQSDTTIYFDAGSGKTPININEKEITSEEFSPESDNITLTINETDYDFELKEGENFYFVVSQDIGGEKHVARN